MSHDNDSTPDAGAPTLALAVGRALGWPVVDKDTLKSVLLAAGIANEVAGVTSYRLLYALAWDLLVQQRLSVILDSPAAYPITIERATEAARAAGANLRVVLCLAERALRNERLAAPQAHPSQWVVDAGLVGDRWQDWAGHLPPDTLVVHTDRPVAELVPHVLAYVRNKPE